MQYSYKQLIIILTIACCFFVGAPSLVHALTYGWSPMGTVKAKWDSKGIHIFKARPGPLVIGETLATGDLLLDVAGSVGGTSFCDQNGNNCFQPRDVRWRLSGSHMYNINGGNVGVANTNPSQKFDVNGEILASTYVYSSDQRLKTNIEPIHNALEIINNIQGVTFDWKSNGNSAMGLIAQEVEQVAPELVHTGSDGYKAVDYVSLIAPLVEVVQGHQERINRLSKEI